MLINERLASIRAHVGRRHQCDWVEVERELDQLQLEVAELLERVPPRTDQTPVKVVVTVH